MSGASVTARRIGRERQPIVVVDGFHPDPDGLRTFAAAVAFGPARRHYPGIRADLPPDYFATVRGVLQPVLAEVFGKATAIDLLDASFSIVTTPPAALATTQRLPHVDAVQPGRVALVHYLSPAGGDGTGFFRHRATGYETIDARRAPVYHATLERELAATGGAPAGYIADGNALFERIATVEARYNRAAIYRSALLHSGTIAPDATLDSNPARGRLTVTAFLSAR